ncbi:MAG: TolC family protein [Gemmatimonadetes bacterium]|nr:TolC family protein [Gemmatimonadota bacterium]
MTRRHTQARAQTALPALGRALAAALVLLALAATVLVAQEAPRRLTLAEAVAIAQRNNPGYLSARNDQGAADWQVREAYASFLPRVDASAGLTYQEPGVQRIGAIDIGGASTDYLYSGYDLSLSWRLDGNSIFQSSSARANREATQARIRATGFDLESAVTLQYMAAMRARDGVEVAKRQLDRAQQNFELATVRAQSGAVAMVDAKQGEVERGRAEVALIQAQRLYRAEKLRLTEQLGVELQGDVELVSEAQPFEPTWALDDLLERALTAHPSLRAAQAREAVGRAQVRQARSGYFPSFNVSTGLRGNAVEMLNKGFLVTQAQQGVESRRSQCELQNALVAGLSRPYTGFPLNCAQYVFTDAQRQQIVSQSEVFPFDFTKNPLQLSLSVSVPVFNGLATQRQLEQAQASAHDAHEDRRAQELHLRTLVTQAYDNLVTAYQLIALQDRNRQVAEQRLSMARQRYAVGAAAILELLDAQTSVQTAERDYLNALYDFQINLAILEAASGSRLRPEG